jgi:predicted XRE-type DNA-binding protein
MMRLRGRLQLSFGSHQEVVDYVEEEQGGMLYTDWVFRSEMRLSLLEGQYHDLPPEYSTGLNISQAAISNLVQALREVTSDGKLMVYHNEYGSEKSKIMESLWDSSHDIGMAFENLAQSLTIHFRNTALSQAQGISNIGLHV